MLKIDAAEAKTSRPLVPGIGEAPKTPDPIFTIMM